VIKLSGAEFAGPAREDVKDCTKKIKTTIGCPDGGNGLCKVKGKINGCG